MSSDVVTYDWPARIFLVVDQRGKTGWRFLSSLEASGVPAKFAEFARKTTDDSQEVASQARLVLRNGVLGEYKQLMATRCSLEEQRARVMDRFHSTTPRHQRLREHLLNSAQVCAASRSLRGLGSTWTRFGMDALAQRVATNLHREHHAIVDNFLEAEAVAGIASLLCTMHSNGQLQPGEVGSGLRQSKRSDLMCWLPAEADEQPAALHPLLSVLEALLLKLSDRPEVAADLGHVEGLQRGEAQCTCYPGGGARYVRHTDDAKTCTRKLTCILYANARWRPEDGGELRLHLSPPAGCDGAHPVAAGTVASGAVAETKELTETAKDVAPVHNRLVLFWSDARVPHEVLATHRPRYAVSIWYHDARAAQRARERAGAG